MDKFAITSKSVSCLGCSYNKQGSCYWFPISKPIPHEVLLKGCKHRVARVKEIIGDADVKLIVELFDGELL